MISSRYQGSEWPRFRGWGTSQKGASEKSSVACGQGKDRPAEHPAWSTAYQLESGDKKERGGKESNVLSAFNIFFSYFGLEMRQNKMNKKTHQGDFYLEIKAIFKFTHMESV